MLKWLVVGVIWALLTGSDCVFDILFIFGLCLPRRGAWHLPDLCCDRGIGALVASWYMHLHGVVGIRWFFAYLFSFHRNSRIK